MSIDGGLTALGGFLYQTVVALSLKADTFQEYHDTPINNDDLEMLLGFAKDGPIRYEDGDQDLSIQDVLHGDGSGYILVQIKYSSVTPRPPITKYDLKKILSRIQASTERVHAEGRQVTGYSLLTNRPLNADAERIVRAEPLLYSSSLPDRYGEERLKQFARCFGCIDPEIDAGIRRGIGDTLLRATNPRYYGEPIITREMIIQLFTGHRDAHALTPDGVAKKSQRQLKNLSAGFFHLHLKPLLIRESIHKQLSNLVERHAFVILSGCGGNGKTATLWQWMDDCFRSALPQQLGAYYNLDRSQAVQEHFLAQLFCTWAHVPTDHDWYHLRTPEQILDRLEIARMASIKTPLESHPIFVLGLDAIDEFVKEQGQQALDTLIMWFWEQEVQLPRQSRATLIVTCRNSDDLAERLSLTSYTGEKPKPFIDIEVSVDQFSPSELVAAARLQLPLLAQRFEQTHLSLEIQPTFSASSLEGRSVLQPESAALQAVDEEVFQDLRHPTLWRCLLEIENDKVQARVLNGEIAALEQLADHFLRWFCSKMRVRGERQTRYEEVKEVLKVIAHHCDPHRFSRYQNKDWVNDASRTPYMTGQQAKSFFEEALSAGLIVDNGGGWWRWHHPFIGEYLALQPLDEENG